MLFTYGLRTSQRRHGLGVNEWRIIGTLAERPGERSAELQSALELDKATVSRTVHGLIASGHVGFVETSRRSRHLFLTSNGSRVARDIVPIALERQDLVLNGFTRSEREELFQYLRRLQDNESLLRQHLQKLQPLEGNPGGTERK